MDHLSELEIFAYLDRLVPSAVERDVEAHCASCARCRKQVEFHRALARGAADPLAGLLADDFTERIVARVHVPDRHAPRFSWLLRNSANIIAMTLVLAVLVAVGYFSAPAPAPDTPNATGNSVYTNIITVWNGLSSSIMSVFTRHGTDTITPAIVSRSEKVFGNIFWLAAAAFLILALADKLRHRLKILSTPSR